MIRKITDFFRYDIKRMFIKIIDFFRYDIKRGIRNLIIWFPIIWQDRNWDHFFIYKILRYKLHLTEQLIRYHGHHLYHIKDADKIKKCILLLDRLIADEYHESAFKPYYDKWGEPKMIFTELKDNPEMCKIDFKYPVYISKKDEIKQNKQFKQCSKMEQTLKEQDLDMLFKLMRKHIQGWWD